MQEYWDLYDIEKNKLGRKMKRNDWTMAKGEYYISVLCALKRSDNRFLVTRRDSSKPWAPLWWELPGGAVQSGESSEEAAVREMKEETGIDVSECNAKLALSYHKERPGHNYIVDVYLYEMDVKEADIVLQEGETIEFAFLTEAEIAELGRQNIFLHYDSIKAVFNN